MLKPAITSMALAIPLVLSSSLAQATRYDSNFSELDKSVSCSIQKQEALTEENQQLTNNVSGLREKLARAQGQLKELTKQAQANQSFADLKKTLEDENNRLKDQIREINTQTDQYLLICRDYKNQLDNSNELNKVLKDSVASKDQRIMELQQSESSEKPGPINCPEPQNTTSSIAVNNCPDVQTIYSNQNQPAAIPAHEYLLLEGIYRLKNTKRAKAIRSVRKYLPMPLDKATYWKLVSEGFDEQKSGWSAKSDAAAYLIQYRPRDLTPQDIKEILGASVNNQRNKLLQSLLMGASFPISFENAHVLVDGYYDETKWGQERKAEAIHMLSFYLSRNLTDDQVFQLVSRLTGKNRNAALASLKAKIRTDFSHAQKEKLLNGFYAQSKHGKENWNRGYDALTPEKRNFIY